MLSSSESRFFLVVANTELLFMFICLQCLKLRHHQFCMDIKSKIRIWLEIRLQWQWQCQRLANVNSFQKTVITGTNHLCHLAHDTLRLDTLFPWLFSLMAAQSGHAILIANKSENNSHSSVRSLVRLFGCSVDRSVGRSVVRLHLATCVSFYFIPF